jgi:hypothetical protein
MKIAFNGKICSGKTTTAEYTKIINEKFEIFNFAGRMKEIATELFGYDPNNKNRELLQEFGSKVREISPDAWIKSLDHRTSGKEFLIIDDLRMENEYEYCKKNGYIIIRLDVSPEVQEKRIKDIYPDNWKDHLDRRNHITETALDNYKFDYRINTDEIEKINDKITQIYFSDLKT